MTQRIENSSRQEFGPSPNGVEVVSSAGRYGWKSHVAARCELTDRVQVANQLLSHGELADAAVQFQTLHQIGLKIHDAELTELACHNLAAALRQSKNWDAAEIWQQQSLSWRMQQAEKSARQSANELGRLACDLTGCGCDAFLKGDWDLAESFWRRALAIEEWRGSLEGQATDFGNLGLLAAARGYFEDATRCLSESLRLHRLMFDESGIGTDLLNLAEVSRLQNEFSRTIRLLREAAESFERANAVSLQELAESRLREVQRIVSLKKHNPILN